MGYLLFSIYAISIGFVNGLFGSGGGILAILLLEKLGLQGKSSHATSISIILPLSIISTVIYWLRTPIPLDTTIPYILFGFLGCWVGSHWLKSIDNFYLKKIFAGFMIYSAVRMILK